MCANFLGVNMIPCIMMSCNSVSFFIGESCILSENHAAFKFINSSRSNILISFILLEFEP